MENNNERSVNLDPNISGDAYVPYIRPDENIKEFSIRAIILGILIGMLFGAANVFVGMKMGMTFCTALPAAVISMAILRGLMRTGTILENNIVQTVGSAASALTGGVIFTVPAFFIIGQADKINFWLIIAYSVLGSVMGVFLMVPLRRHLCREQHGKLPFPEGTACAEVLCAGEVGGAKAKYVFLGVAIGAVYAFLANCLKLFSYEWTLSLAQIKKLFIQSAPIDKAKEAIKDVSDKAVLGGEMSAINLAVGYILGPRIGAVMFAGGLLSSMILIPMIAYFGADAKDTFMIEGKLQLKSISEVGFYDIWTKYIRYIGAGAVTFGGLLSIVKSLPVIVKAFSKSIRHFGSKDTGETVARTDHDLPLSFLVGFCFLVFLLLAFIPGLHIGFIGAILTVVFAFFFVVVTSRLTGEIGSSANPVSGMTLTSLIFISFILIACATGPDGKELAKTAALSCAVVVCIAVCLGGEIAQDLKTGFLVGGTPRKQQIGEVIGAITGAAIVVGTVFLLQKTYGITGDPSLTQAQIEANTALKAPQANVMALVLNGIFDNKIAWDLFLVGGFIGMMAALMGVSVLAFAVGVYLPVMTSLPIMVGGLIQYITSKTTKDEKLNKERGERGMLYASGLLAGEAIIGIVIAVCMLIMVQEPQNYQEKDPPAAVAQAIPGADKDADKPEAEAAKIEDKDAAKPEGEAAKSEDKDAAKSEKEPRKISLSDYINLSKWYRLESSFVGEGKSMVFVGLLIFSLIYFIFRRDKKMIEHK